jgi:hypothetical protein
MGYLFRESPSRYSTNERSKSESKENEKRESVRNASTEKSRSSVRKEEPSAIASQKIFIDELGRVIDEKGNIIPRVITNLITVFQYLNT